MDAWNSNLSNARSTFGNTSTGIACTSAAGCLGRISQTRLRSLAIRCAGKGESITRRGKPPECGIYLARKTCSCRGRRSRFSASCWALCNRTATACCSPSCAISPRCTGTCCARTCEREGYVRRSRRDRRVVRGRPTTRRDTHGSFETADRADRPPLPRMPARAQLFLISHHPSCLGARLALDVRPVATGQRRRG